MLKTNAAMDIPTTPATKDSILRGAFSALVLERIRSSRTTAHPLAVARGRLAVGEPLVRVCRPDRVRELLLSVVKNSAARSFCLKVCNNPPRIIKLCLNEHDWANRRTAIN